MLSSVRVSQSAGSPPCLKFSFRKANHFVCILKVYGYCVPFPVNQFSDWFALRLFLTARGAGASVVAPKNLLLHNLQQILQRNDVCTVGMCGKIAYFLRDSHLM